MSRDAGGRLAASLVGIICLAFGATISADPKPPKGGKAPAEAKGNAERAPTALEKAISESKSAPPEATGARPKAVPPKAPTAPPRRPSSPLDRSPKVPAHEAPPSIRAASPSEVRLVAASRTTTTVKLTGTGLDRLRSVAVRAGERPAQGVRASLRPGGESRAVLELSADKGAPTMDGLTVELVGGVHRVEVPLRVSVQGAVPPATPPPFAGPPESIRERIADPAPRNPPRRPVGPPRRPPPTAALPGPVPPDPNGPDRTLGRARPQQLLGLIVRVEDEDGGAPIAGASVCLGKPDLPVAYGMQQTNARGEATFRNAPPGVGLQAIVSRQGYEGTVDNVDYDLPEQGDLEDCPPPFVVGGDFEPDGGDDCEPFDRDTVEIERGEGGPTCPPDRRGTLRVAIANGAGATVCLGGSQGPSQFGGARAGPAGDVAFADVPLATPMRLLVDHAGFERLEQAVMVQNEGVTERAVSLTAGSGGGQIELVDGACRQRVLAAPPPAPPTLVRDDSGDAAPPASLQTPAAAELFTEARNRGYTFLSEPGGVASCAIQHDDLVIRWGKVPLSDLFTLPCCTYRMFQGRDLQPGWSIRARVDPPADMSATLEQRPSDQPGGNPEFAVRVCPTRQTDRDAWYEIPWRVTFSGPQGEDWRNAFRP